MINYKTLGLVNTREMFKKAIDGGYAIPAFNFNNMEQLQAIIDGDLVLEKLRTDVVEVKLWKETEGKFEAIREEAYIAVTSYGGDTTGYQIPFTLHYTGKKTKGYFDVATRTFTEA